jgi:hypothetical protein
MPHPIATLAPVDIPFLGGGTAGGVASTGGWGSGMVTS